MERQPQQIFLFIFGCLGTDVFGLVLYKGIKAMKPRVKPQIYESITIYYIVSPASNVSGSSDMRGTNKERQAMQEQGNGYRHEMPLPQRHWRSDCKC